MLKEERLLINAKKRVNKILNYWDNADIGLCPPLTIAKQCELALLIKKIRGYKNYIKAVRATYNKKKS